MVRKTITSTLLSYTIYLSGIILFMYGFFPISHDGNEMLRATQSDLPLHLGEKRLNASQYYKKRFSKTALLIIDAMRYDFITKGGRSHMHYVNEKLIKQEACLLKLKAEVPTVTLPRIKSLTTGTISNFIDVVLNFGSSQLQSDSLITQLHNRGDRIVFCGDNTWVKLFPKQFYKEYVNNDSFFVQDFYKGDKRITEQLHVELNKDDWEFMILHYLGLDHIGHVEGPFSPKIPIKLNEMDDVVKEIHVNFKRKNSLLLVTSDHGMRDIGGHGGNSPPEIIVPFLAFNELCTTDNEILYNQIDVTPTAAVLLGLPIPATSIGCIIPELVQFLPLKDQLYAFYYNNKHLLQKIAKLPEYNVNSEYFLLHSEGMKLHEKFLETKNSNSSKRMILFEEAKENYENSSIKISEFLRTKLTHFDMFSIFSGIVLSVTGTSLLIFLTFFVCKFSIFFLKLFGTILILLAVGQMWFTDVFIRFLINNILGGLLLYLITCNANMFHYTLIPSYYEKPPYLFIGTIIYTLSLGCSSFIEEEHQLWYYILSTIFIFLGVKEIVIKVKKITRHNEENFSIVTTTAIQWIAFIGMHIFLRKLNQTGDKWIHLPDIGDWFNKENNWLELSAFCICSLILSSIVLSSFADKYLNIFIFVASCLICYYRLTTGLLLSYPPIEYRYIVSMFWLCISAILLLQYCPVLYNHFTRRNFHLPSIKKLLSGNVALFGLISMLLHKSHNIILVPSCIITLNIIFSTCNHILKDRKQLLLYKAILGIWIGKLFYFYQGNSNNLASIDLNSGFIGLEHYNLYLSGSLITLNTFFGPLCSFTMLLYETFDKNDIEETKENLQHLFLVISLSTAIPTTFYLFLMMEFRSHLFIWSVFSPKFLYEAFTSVLYYALLLITFIFYKILKIL